jgi:hypothetical protein
MYFWDVYMDWGLLRKSEKGGHKRFLRKELSYNHPNFYYLAMLLNFVLRMSFIISISPNLLNTILEVMD